MSDVVRVLACALLLFPSVAAAQDIPDPQAAIEQALAAYPGYQAAAIQVRRSRDHVRAEENRYQLVLHLETNGNVGSNPSITAGFGGSSPAVVFPYAERINVIAELQRAFDTGTLVTLRTTGYRQFGRQNVTLGTPMLVTVGPGYGLDVALTVTQPFLRGFGTEVGAADLRQARVDLARVEAARDRRASELVRDVLSAYANLWYAQEAVRIDLASQTLAQRQHDEAAARIEVGVLAPSDRLAFATRVAQIEELLAIAESDRRSRQLALATLLGRGDQEFSLDEGAMVIVGEPVTVPFPVSDAEAVDIALASAPQLAELRAQVDLAREAARIATQAIQPRLDAQAQVAFHGLGLDDVGATFTQVGGFSAVSVLFSLIYETPLEDTRLHEEEERANLAIDAAEAAVREAELTITQQVLDLLLTRRVAHRRIELAQETVALAHQTVEAALARIEIGTAQTALLLDAEEQERAAQLRLSRAEADLVVSEAALGALTGRLLDDVALPE
jgi:outer membrane protein TolC